MHTETYKLVVNKEVKDKRSNSEERCHKQEAAVALVDLMRQFKCKYS